MFAFHFLTSEFLMETKTLCVHVVKTFFVKSLTHNELDEATKHSLYLLQTKVTVLK